MLQLLYCIHCLTYQSSKKGQPLGEPGFLVVASSGVRFEERGSGDVLYQDFIKSIKYTAAMPSSDSKFDIFGYVAQDDRLVSSFFY